VEVHSRQRGDLLSCICRECLVCVHFDGVPAVRCSEWNGFCLVWRSANGLISRDDSVGMRILGQSVLLCGENRRDEKE
jgi:hypothetical protein